MEATFSGSTADALELVRLLNYFVRRDIMPLMPILTAELSRCLPITQHASTIESAQYLSTACANYTLQLMDLPQGPPKAEAHYVAIPAGLGQYRMQIFYLILVTFSLYGIRIMLSRRIKETMRPQTEIENFHYYVGIFLSVCLS